MNVAKHAPAKVTGIVRKLLYINSQHQRPKGPKGFPMNTIKYLLALVAIAALAACGGGGGGGTTTTPTGSITASASGCVIQQDAATCRVSITSTSTNAVTPQVKNAAGAVISTDPNGTVPVDVRVGGDTYTFTFGASSPATVTVSATCIAGTTANAAGVCKAPVVATWWPPATITPMGVKVFGANQLPVGCNRWADQCWRDAVANGTVKFVATTATDSTGRPITFAYFRNTSTAFGVTGLWNVLAIYADDGSLAANDIFGGGSSEIDYVFTNTDGVIVHDASNNLCTQLYYFDAGSTWSPRAATCPL